MSSSMPNGFILYGSFPGLPADTKLTPRHEEILALEAAGEALWPEYEALREARNDRRWVVLRQITKIHRQAHLIREELGLPFIDYVAHPERFPITEKDMVDADEGLSLTDQEQIERSWGYGAREERTA